MTKAVWTRVALTVLAPLFLLANSAAPLNFTLDEGASAVSAKVAFFGLSSKTARFPKMDGKVTVVPGAPERAVIDVTFDASALEAPDETTLNRLRGERFFWVEKYPEIRFVGSALTLASDTTGTVKGKLTARGVTREEELEIIFDRDPHVVPEGTPVNFSGMMRIDRRDYGMKSYPLIVGRKVDITIMARMLPGKGGG